MTMRVSCIEHPASSRFVILRPHYVELCGHGCAAMLLAVIEGWTNWRLQHIELDEATDESRWLRLSNRQLEADLAGAYGRAAIRTGIEKLIELGFIAVNDSGTSDRSKLYLLDVKAVNEAIVRFRTMEDAKSNDATCEIERSTRAGDTAVKNEVKEPTDVELVWSHFVKALKADRQTLDSTRTTIIRNALKVRSLDECKRAIDGLSVSPFHNGDNDQKKKYLGIRYALKGIGAESNDERIDKMIDIADEHGGVLRGGKLPSDHPRIKRWLRAVQVAWHSRTEMSRGRESLISLRQNGYDVEKLDEAPWVKLVVKAA